MRFRFVSHPISRCGGGTGARPARGASARGAGPEHWGQRGGQTPAGLRPVPRFARLCPRACWVFLVAFGVLVAESTPGQSLALTLDAGRDLVLEASAPPGARYVLQASGNLRLWIDIDDEVRSRASYRFAGGRGGGRFFRLAAWTPPPPPIRVALAGDSTVQDGSGWGKGIYAHFKPTVQVVNLAWAAFTTRAFLASEQFPKLLLVRPEFVLIQFGLMDSTDDPAVGTTLPEYAENLRIIVRTVRDFEGIPILMTPPVANWFDDRGKVVPILKDRSAVVREVAAELRTPLVDLNRLSIDLFDRLGESGTEALFLPDRFHFTVEGARVVSELIAEALPEGLGPYLTGSLEPPPRPGE
jgi:lysophospholipase L1-like esterase